MVTQGPNVKKLIAHRMSQQIVPPGGGLADAIGAMVEPGKLLAVSREATTWVEAAIQAVKSAPDCRFEDDEAIAGEILSKISERLGKFPQPPRKQTGTPVQVRKS